MTDTITFYRTVVSQATNFIQAYTILKASMDRIAADSNLSTSAAAAAVAGGRADLTAAKFDNLQAATALVTSLLNAQTGGNVTVTINTGGKVVLAFNDMM